MLFFAFTPATPENLQKRQGILYAFALFKGLSLAPLIQMSLAINPANIFIALSSVALLFLCFTASVLYSPDRRPMMLFTAALISSLSGMAFWMMLVNMFLWSSSIMWMEMYVGLALFSLYVVMDTQVKKSPSRC